MRTRSASISAGLLAAGLLLAGCGGDPASSAAGQMSSTPPQAAPAPATSASPATQEPAEQEDGGSTDGTAAARCTDADLSVSINEPTGDPGGQQSSLLAWRNTTDRPCTMTGFGGVDLRGPDDPTFGPTYSLPRSSEKPTTVTLKPGGTGITTIRTLGGGDWTPTEVVVTAPDETTSKTVPWRGGAVQRQDGATRPGTYIGPVEQGSL